MKLNSAFLLTSSAAIIWGATAPIMKLALTEVPIFSLAFIRIACAVTGVSLNLAFFFWGLKLTQAINASFLIASVPIFTILAAHFYLKEKFNSRLILTSLIAFAVVALIIV